VIDARRWALVEAWLSLGLRIEWCPSYEEQRFRAHWQSSQYSDEKFLYAGAGAWKVLDRQSGRRMYGPRPTAPQLATEDLAHELAHYLAATKEQRGEINFGMADGDDDAEERAMVAEQVIDAVLTACNRIAGLAMQRSAP
jgi:hypothetical protein